MGFGEARLATRYHEGRFNRQAQQRPRPKGIRPSVMKNRLLALLQSAFGQPDQGTYCAASANDFSTIIWVNINFPWYNSWEPIL